MHLKGHLIAEKCQVIQTHQYLISLSVYVNIYKLLQRFQLLHSLENAPQIMMKMHCGDDWRQQCCNVSIIEHALWFNEATGTMLTKKNGTQHSGLLQIARLRTLLEWMSFPPGCRCNLQPFCDSVRDSYRLHCSNSSGKLADLLILPSKKN